MPGTLAHADVANAKYNEQDDAFHARAAELIPGAVGYPFPDIVQMMNRTDYESFVQAGIFESFLKTGGEFTDGNDRIQRYASLQNRGRRLYLKTERAV